MNETQLWYCDRWDETIKFSSILRHVNSESHKHEKKDGDVVKEYEFIKPEIDEVNYILNDTIKYCKNKYFLSFEYWI